MNWFKTAQAKPLPLPFPTDELVFDEPNSRGVGGLKYIDRIMSEETAKQQKLYQQINNEINKDVPAIFLYSPLYLYVTPNTLQGVGIKNINTASERFDTVHEWYLKQEYVWKIFRK